jgi:hypothetical protein
MVSLSNSATSATWRVYASAGLVSVVFAAIAKIKNVAYIIRANIGRGGGGKAQPAFVFVGVPSLAGGGVEDNFISGSNRRAGARVLSGIFGDHSFLHGFPLCGLKLDHAALASGRMILNNDIARGLAGAGAQ